MPPKRRAPRANKTGFYFIEHEDDVGTPLKKLNDNEFVPPMVPPSSSADAGPIGAFMDQHRPRFVAANSAGCDDDPGLADRSLRAAWTAMPEAEREEYVRTLRWNEWAAENEPELVLGSANDEVFRRVLDFMDAADEYLLKSPGNAMGLIKNRQLGAMEAGMRVLGCGWAVNVAGAVEKTDFPDVDRKFGARGMAALGLVIVAGEAPTRPAFSVAHRACYTALELCCYASSWHNGDQVALRWAEMAVRAAKTGAATLGEVEAIEFFLESIGCRVGSLMGRHLQKAIMAAGRAVAELGGSPLTMKEQQKILSLTCVPGVDPADRIAAESKRFIFPRPVIKPVMVDDDEHGVIEVGALFDREGRFYCCRHECEVRGETKTCAACGFVSYCSVDCQRADWKSHKSSCYPRKKSAEIPKWTKWR